MPLYAEIAFPIPLNRGFHYAIPAHLQNGEGPRLGSRVIAPFGKTGRQVGFVIGFTDEKPAFETKPIAACLDPEPFIDEPLLQLAKWLSSQYLCSLGEALASIVPPLLAPPKRQAAALPDEVHEPKASFTASGAPIVLNADQAAVMTKLSAAMETRDYKPFLLRGITDSGKTELYLRAIDQTLAQGRQALFLLPEIALTPPFIHRLRARYGAGRVGLWHSGVTPNQRYLTWTGVRQGDVQVLLGARSAVFAPFRSLGLIIMDEEHEPSYKQDDRPRYHTREVALKRAQLSKALLVMGSATPSLESYWRAQQGEFELVELLSRVEQRMLPPVTLVDQRPPAVQPGQSRRRRGPGYLTVFSEPLKLAIEQRLARREQTMLFVNRRGFTPFLRCQTCGWVARCQRCSTTLAFHVKEDLMKAGKVRGDYMPVPADAELQCHACLYKERPPISCPACEGMRLRQFGVGTQRVEQELRKLFPFATLARLDHDAAGSRKVYERVYQDFANRQVDILIGTQMIAKGFDFPHVTLVGVVDADVSLHLPDFRSAERTFQLVAQVAGRTGRGDAKGSVLVQTHHPEHYALQAAQAHDFLQFYQQEIGYRESLRYPPFSRLVNIVLRAGKEPAAQGAADTLYEKLATLGPGVDLLGPAPAPYSRVRGQWRFQILLKGTTATLEPYLSFLRHYRAPKAFMSIDVDPVDLL